MAGDRDTVVLLANITIIVVFHLDCHWKHVRTWLSFTLIHLNFVLGQWVREINVLNHNISTLLTLAGPDMYEKSMWWTEETATSVDGRLY